MWTGKHCHSYPQPCPRPRASKPQLKFYCSALTRCRQIVTNHFLHFLALDRSDPKKFQILQLIAALLGWTDEQREQAGLARPGGFSNTSTLTSTSLRLPASPSVHRTPSTPALHNEYFGPDNVTSPGSRETLAELWQNFLEQESGANVTRTGQSRQASQSMVPPPSR